MNTIAHWTYPDALWWYLGANYCGKPATNNEGLTIVRDLVTCPDCLKMLGALDELEAEKVEA